MIAFATWLWKWTDAETIWELLPDLRSNDQRRGFEHLEPVVINLLMASLFLFATFFLTRLDNAYVESSRVSIFEFAREDLGAGFFKHSISDIPKMTFHLPDNSLVYPLVAVGMAMGIRILSHFWFLFSSCIDARKIARFVQVLIWTNGICRVKLADPRPKRQVVSKEWHFGLLSTRDHPSWSFFLSCLDSVSFITS